MEIVKTRKLIFVVNTAAFFLSHRQRLASKAIDTGYEVYVLAPPDEKSVEKIQSLGFKFVALPMSRKGTNPFSELATLFFFYKTFAKIKPDIVHAFTLKPVLYSSLVKFFIHFKLVTSFTGLGFLFTSTSLKSRILRQVVAILLRNSFSQRDIKVVFQNPDDQKLFEDLNVVKPGASTIIPGTGVDTNRFRQTFQNDQPIIVFPARFLRDKGLMETIRACDILYNRGVKFELWLMGKLDSGNPSAISQEELDKIRERPYVTKVEYSNSMESIYSSAQVVCLPSYREGIPLALIEASSCGRAIVTTDAPGCRSIVEYGNNGLLVPVGDSEQLSKAIEKILLDANLRKQMESHSRKKALSEFDENIVLAHNLELYN